MHCEKSKFCEYQSEEFNNVLSFIGFPIDQNYFVLCEIQFPLKNDFRFLLNF
jgi:hypothetical protein